MMLYKHFKILTIFQKISILMIIVVQINSFCGQDNVFNDNSEQYLTVNRSQRRGRRNKAEVTWDAFQMLNDTTCHDIQSATLQIKIHGITTWETSKENMTFSGRKRKWTVGIKPCFRYYFRVRFPLNVQTKDRGYSGSTAPETSLEPLTKEELLASQYTPDPPSYISVNVSTQHAILTWNPIDCVTDYEVIYFETGKEDNLAIKKIKNETSVVIDNLKPCTNYKTSVYAIINDNYGELASDFATKPARAVITDLNIDVKVSSNEIEISWPTWENVSCINQYEIKAYVANHSCMVHEGVVQRNIGAPSLVYGILGLASNETYEIDIKPLFEQMDLNVKEITVQTEPSSDAIQDNDRKNICISNESTYQTIDIKTRQEENNLHERSIALGWRESLNIKLYYIVIIYSSLITNYFGL